MIKFIKDFSYEYGKKSRNRDNNLQPGTNNCEYNVTWYDKILMSWKTNIVSNY